MDVIYLDHHATTPCDPQVVEAMLPYFTKIFGNAASLTHVHGRRAANAVEDARIAIARFFKAQPNEIYFTAGATESNNIALNLLKPGEHMITSAIEHKSVLMPAERLRDRGVDLTIVKPDREGFVSADLVRDALRPNTRLVSIEAANGEVGTIQPVAEIASLCRSRGVLFHTDITQAAGKIPFDVESVQADLASFSAHKIYGPKGVGGLFVRRGVRVEPLIIGGGQEKRVRSGTVNVPGAVGMAAAFRLRAAEMAEEAQRLTALRDALWDRLLAEVPEVSVNGPRALRLPGNLNTSFARVDADSIMVAMKRFSLSSGSACSSGERGPSRVLLAIGVGEEMAMGSIRFGLGKSNTSDHVSMLVDDLKRVVARLRENSAA
jgi:cysteine desulfurase